MKILEEPVSGVDKFWSLLGPGPGVGALVLAPEIAILANTHPIMVPTNAHTWANSNISVVKWMPMNFGSLRCLRKERLPTMDMEAVSEAVSEVPEYEGASSIGSSDGVGGRRSAGCLAGKGKGSEEGVIWDCTWTCSWSPSMKPISPRFNGRGPACGLDSCIRMVEEVDAIAAVDAIIDRSGRSGRSGKGKTVEK